MKAEVTVLSPEDGLALRGMRLTKQVGLHQRISNEMDEIVGAKTTTVALKHCAPDAVGEFTAYVLLTWLREEVLPCARVRVVIRTEQGHVLAKLTRTVSPVRS